MNVLVCIDKDNGMMFFGKRQSQDIVQREKMLELIGQQKVFMTAYSAKLFDNDNRIVIDDNYLTNATENDYCFIENGDYDIDKCSVVVLYKWNRKYPADRYFDVQELKKDFKLVKKSDFAGKSHEKITEEVYERKGK